MSDRFRVAFLSFGLVAVLSLASVDHPFRPRSPIARRLEHVDRECAAGRIGLEYGPSDPFRVALWVSHCSGERDPTVSHLTSR